MRLQTLPPLARNYSAAQLAEIDQATKAVERQWRRMGTNFDASWMTIRPTVLAIALKAQQNMAERAAEFIPNILEETGQTRAVKAVAETNTAALVGVTGSGYRVERAISLAPIRAKQGVAAGNTAYQSLTSAGAWLSYGVGGMLADTARTAESLGTYTRPVSGFVRMVNGGACGRCVVLAGKWFRKNQGFSRHPPTCRCFHIPASENVGGDWRTDPSEFFDSLNEDAQTKLVGSRANAQAVRDGADINQVVNAYRRSSGMQFAQQSPIKVVKGFKFTTEGTTKRALAHKAQTSLRTRGPAQMRLMPESIYKRAKGHDDALRMLKLYGWILP